jgi:hypothetical protein
MPPYYGLRICQVICNALAVLIVIVVIGMAGYNVADATQNHIAFSEIAGSIVGSLLFGGLLAFACFILAQLIDMTLTTNRNVYMIAAEIKRLQEETRRETSSNEQVLDVLEKQNRMLRALGQSQGLDQDIPVRINRTIPGSGQAASGRSIQS